MKLVMFKLDAAGIARNRKLLVEGLKKAFRDAVFDQGLAILAVPQEQVIDSDIEDAADNIYIGYPDTGPAVIIDPNDINQVPPGDYVATRQPGAFKIILSHAFDNVGLRLPPDQVE